MEFFVAYEVATGVVSVRGTGYSGDAARQSLPAGMAVKIISAEAPAAPCRVTESGQIELI